MLNVEELLDDVIIDLEGQNWTDRKLSDQERDLIRMVIQVTLDKVGIS